MGAVQAAVTLPPDATSVRRARAFVRDILTAWERDDLAEAAILLTSELVTNAVLHARTQIELVARLRAACLRVEVRDADGRAPALKLYSHQSATGRGLVLVEELADRWGTESMVGGKLVWFELGEKGPAPSGTAAGMGAAPGQAS